ncbi:septal ring factor EnvC (AmiA/AmiB activator) [Endobacter medicaginis]|uniref:Septal ring factor EnvC (AmiA/AmiB activator) n=2 Tax=Endobacter medicaginis TaxID=1181271 RepID=A0A839UWU2_9PROT|nr:septal ring factor EnvC (AmiA/AmiB activator) [Endobacter medicaginis]
MLRAGRAVLAAIALLPGSTLAAPHHPHPSAEARQAAHAAAVRREAEARARLQRAETDRAAREAARAAAARVAAADAARAAALAAATKDAAATLRATERRADDVADQVADTARRRADAQAKLAAATARLAPLLPLMQRLSLYPDQTLLAIGGDAAEATSGITLLHGISANIAAQIADIRADQQAIARLDAELAARAQALEAARADQQQARDALASRTRAATKVATTAQANADAAARAAADAAQRTASLRDAIDAIAQAERTAQAQYARDLAAAAKASDAARMRQLRQSHAEVSAPAGPGVAAGGSAPVTGTVLHGWHSQTEAGLSEGITYATASQSVVSAPCQGRVEFAAPFRSYGQMMILDCGRNFRFILAGFDHIDATIGTRVSKGQALGRMPAWNPTGGAARPTLYVQLRQGTNVIDPGRYLGQ